MSVDRHAYGVVNAFRHKVRLAEKEHKLLMGEGSRTRRTLPLRQRKRLFKRITDSYHILHSAQLEKKGKNLVLNYITALTCSLGMPDDIILCAEFVFQIGYGVRTDTEKLQMAGISQHAMRQYVSRTSNYEDTAILDAIYEVGIIAPYILASWGRVTTPSIAVPVSDGMWLGTVIRTVHKNTRDTQTLFFGATFIPLEMFVKEQEEYHKLIEGIIGGYDKDVTRIREVFTDESSYDKVGGIIEQGLIKKSEVWFPEDAIINPELLGTEA